jgi:DNA-binding cell septation regulator SpoVG
LLELRARLADRSGAVSCLSCRAAVPESALEVHDVGIVVAPPHVRDTGLMAWASVSIAAIVVIDGLTVRMSTGGTITIEWPMRKAEKGPLHAVAYVLDDDLRRRVEAAVLTAFLREARRAGGVAP